MAQHSAYMIIMTPIIFVAYKSCFHYVLLSGTRCKITQENNCTAQKLLIYTVAEMDSGEAFGLGLSLKNINTI